MVQTQHFGEKGQKYCRRRELFQISDLFRLLKDSVEKNVGLATLFYEPLKVFFDISTKLSEASCDPNL